MADAWTVDILKEYFEAIIRANDARYEQRFETQQSAVNTAFLSQQTAMITALDTAKEAVMKAEMAAEKRFEAVNEFRKTLTDQQVTFITRVEVNALLKVFDDKIETLKIAIEKNADIHAKSEIETRLELSRTLKLDAYEIRHAELRRQIVELQQNSSATGASRTTTREFIAYGIAIIAALAAVIIHFL